MPQAAVDAVVIMLPVKLIYMKTQSKVLRSKFLVAISMNLGTHTLIALPQSECNLGTRLAVSSVAN